MSIEVLINVPAGFTVPDEPETEQEKALADTIRRLYAIWIGNPQPGTRKYDGRKLIVGKVRCSLDELEQAIASFGLDWQVLGAKSHTMIRTPRESDVMPFMPDVPITDDEGNVTGYERPAHPRVGIYAGSIAWEYS